MGQTCEVIFPFEHFDIATSQKVFDQLRRCATGGITVDPAMGGGNRLQIRDQRLRYAPGADFE